jgi:phage recombination protein Bet
MVHIVPMWSSEKRGYIETVWPGIAEIRTTAFRTGQYAGKEETEFGPMIEKKFEGQHRNEDKVVVVTFPEWGRMRIRRTLDGVERVFMSPKVYWQETYGRLGNSTLPNDMWAKRPIGQFEKCVEAAALRCAFPEEIGNEYAAEEMEGRVIDNLTPEQHTAATAAKPTLSNALDLLAGERAAEQAKPVEAEVVELRREPPEEQQQASIEPAATQEAQPDEDAIPEGLRRNLDNSIKRPDRIDLEAELKTTIDATGILGFLRVHAARIDKLGPAERHLFDKAVQHHQDVLKQRETD